MKKLLIILILIFIFMYFVYINYNRAILVSNFDNYHVDSEDFLDIEILTYNIQHGVGIDGNLNLNRISNVIKNSGADIIGLNEIDMFMNRSGFSNQTSYLAEKLDMNYAYGPSKNAYPGSYGNSVLSRFPIINIENIPLPVFNKDSGEPRSLLKAEIEISPDKSIYILLTHLSLNRDERKVQLRWINEYIDDLSKPYILMGDFNAELQEILAYSDNTTGKMRPLINDIKTYPASNPINGIDLYFSNTQIEVLEGYSIRSNASDHLPVYLKLRVYN